MWAMEYNPNIFSKYEDPDRAKTKSPTPEVNDKVLKQYGKFERENLKTGHAEESSALAIFLVAGVLETKHKQMLLTKNKKILTEAKGVDEVVKVSISFFPSPTMLCMHTYMCFCMHASHLKLSLQILGDITSSLDAKKALTEALKIQKKYLKVSLFHLVIYLFLNFSLFASFC